MRLEVGDVRLDTEGALVVPHSPARTPVSPAHAVANAPPWLKSLVAVAATLIAAVLTVVSIVFSVWPLLVPAALFVRLASHTAISAIGPMLRRETVPVADVVRILDVMNDEVAVTASEVRDRLQWSERRTIAALARAVATRRIEEDLELDSGRWIYRRLPALPCAGAPDTLTAEDRLRAIHIQTRGSS